MMQAGDSIDVAEILATRSGIEGHDELINDALIMGEIM